jgi:phospholipid/cholesterol/gamma-HCH transport system ATP-binding protein
LAENPRDEETRQHDVPAGYDDEQDTAQSDSPPPPPPPGYDEQPTEVNREAYAHDETDTGETVTDEHDAVPYEEDTTQVDEPTPDRDREAATVGAASVQSEPEPRGDDGDEDDEYRWHTDRTARSETAERDAVEFIDVKKSFGRNTILNGLNLGIPDDQISMILGPSGTGKSVCIKHMVGLLYPDEGDVLVHGESVPNMADDELFEMRKKFGVLFQDGALFGSMNLWDNVAFPLRQHTDKGEDEIADIVNRRLKEVGLGGAGEKMPNELSGGMRKRAGFARALVLDPQIVLFDEPDSGLDPVRTALLCELIQEIHEENGGAYVVITHDIMSARRVAEYIAILWKGRIVESGPAEELFNSDNQFVRQFLSGEARGPLGME